MRARTIGLLLGGLALLISAFARHSMSAPTTLANPGTLTISDLSPYSAVYAVSDVHGMFAAAQALLRENNLIDGKGNWSGGKVLLVVVGDSIDKGSQSIDVLDQWIRLASQAEAAGGMLVHLLGNHEAEFLADPTPSNEKAQALFDELSTRGIPVEQLTNPQYPRGRFLRSLPLAARVGNWLFCHAGFLPDTSWSDLTSQASTVLNGANYGDPFLIGGDSILEAKKWWQIGSSTRAALESRLDRSNLKGVVFGHQPKALNVSHAIAQSDDGRLIKIDNGMAPEAGSHPGSLLFFPNPSELSGAVQPHAFALKHGRREALASEGRTEPQD